MSQTERVRLIRADYTSRTAVVPAGIAYVREAIWIAPPSSMCFADDELKAKTIPIRTYTRRETRIGPYRKVVYVETSPARWIPPPQDPRSN